jgi:GH15 family glucan-1,4-alpha-glucosidase
LFDDTVRFWHDWLARSTYVGRWREMVHRSAITLKLMTYAPTGGLVAAPTAGLPEQVGGERNWDYRYTWVRDASFSVLALLRLGFVDEAARFGGWLGDRIRERVGGEGGPLNIMYRVDGSSDLKEEVLEHWAGYRGSRPVRIGNGAADQLQLDIYGEALDSIYAADRAGQLVPGRPGVAGSRSPTGG